MRDYNDLEKERLRQKWVWCGGLVGLIKWGLPKRLYYKYKPEFDVINLFIDETLFIDPHHILINNLSNKIEKYLNTRTHNNKNISYSEEELNSVNYIFTE